MRKQKWNLGGGSKGEDDLRLWLQNYCWREKVCPGGVWIDGCGEASARAKARGCRWGICKPRYKISSTVPQVSTPTKSFVWSMGSELAEIKEERRPGEREKAGGRRKTSRGLRIVLKCWEQLSEEVKNRDVANFEKPVSAAALLDTCSGESPDTGG